MKKMKLIIFLMTALLVAVNANAQYEPLIPGENKYGFIRYYDPTNLETLDIVGAWYKSFDFCQTFLDTIQVSAVGQYPAFWHMNTDSATVTTEGQSGGRLKIVTSLDSTDHCQIASFDSTFHADRNPGFEVRFENYDVDQTSFIFGFFDVDTTAFPDSLQMGMDADTAKAVGNLTNGFGFLWDANSTNSYLYGVAINQGTAGTRLSSATTLADSTVYILRAQCDADTAVTFWLNGSVVGKITSAVYKPTGLHFCIGCLNDETSNNTMYVYRVQLWQRLDNTAKREDE